MPRDPKPWKRPDRDAWYCWHEGKRHYLGATKEDAQREFHKLKAGLPTVKPGQAVTIGDLFDAFLDFQSRERSIATYVEHRRYLRSFSAHAGKSTEAESVRVYDVTTWLASVKSFGDGRRQYGPAGKRAAILSVQAAYNYGIEQGLIEKNPLYKIKKPAKTKNKRVLTAEEIARIHACVPAKDPFRDLLLAIEATGCRPQEIVEIEARHYQPKDGAWVLPKKEGGQNKRQADRWIFLDAVAVEITERLCKRWPTGPIFRNRRGRPWKSNAIRCRFRRIDEKIGLPGLRAYWFRHTFADRLHARGVDLETIRLLMGHSDLSMLSEVYLHADQRPEDLRRALS